MATKKAIKKPVKKTVKKPVMDIGKLASAVYEFTGISPVLMDKPPEILGAPKDKRKTPEAVAEDGCYRNAEGVLYIPPVWFRSSLLGGLVGVKLGRSAAATALKPAIFAIDEEAELYDPKTKRPFTKWTLNSRKARNGTGQLIQLHQAEIWPWACKAAFEVDLMLIDPKDIVPMWNRAGRVSGIGPWRPKGPRGGSGSYGRYCCELVSVTEVGE